jgi:hypothetical protein
MSKSLLFLLTILALSSISYADYNSDLKVFNKAVNSYENRDYRVAFTSWKSLTDDESDLFYSFDFDTVSSEKNAKVPGIEAMAEYKLGILYENGQGVLKSYPKAYEHYRRSATWNYPQAQLAFAKLTIRLLKDDLVEGLTKEKKLNGYKEVADFVSKLYENERATDRMRKEAEELWNQYELHKYSF